ncbi:response regulator [Thiothrix eikelboomii]|uniref:Two-component system, OmpR family, response regulator BaeR n=1 Tax=Thiothrix eikelboomii TaxID=92487 RepID=A0A1T4Y530_9GAMM|nr:response regulator [Thiothrix eikelboomii]SKA96628.1 two-component system, OmpR family, response regulator BaeR [Thiothrix eikelboomii]
MFPVLIVEDEPKIAELLKKYLENAGYKTHWIADGNTASTWLLNNPVELVLLDLMLPGKDGLDICKELRQRAPQPPIIMLTARAEEIDRLLGLELGADDYICKPFSPREVIARVKAVLRRTLPNQSASHLTILGVAGIQLDRERLSVQFSDQQVILTLVEFELLETLQSYPGRIFSRQQLMERVYPDNRIVSDRTIDSHIKKLRKKINALNPERDFIHSVYSVGYKFEP